jgi:hypothetical protein
MPQQRRIPSPAALETSFWLGGKCAHDSKQYHAAKHFKHRLIRTLQRHLAASDPDQDDDKRVRGLLANKGFKKGIIQRVKNLQNQVENTTEEGCQSSDDEETMAVPPHTEEEDYEEDEDEAEEEEDSME